MTGATLRREGQELVLELPGAVDWERACHSLEEILTTAQSLITGQRARLHIGDHALAPEGLDELKALLTQRFSLDLTAIVGFQPEQESIVRKAGLMWQLDAAAAPTDENSAPDPSEGPGLIADNAYYVRQTIRSGQSLRHFGTVVICGDINPGAEVIATGDIIVFGTLRGVAHAGATGDEGAQIVAINLRPTQIRIAGFIARSPDSASPPLSKYPEVARIQDNEIHILPLRDTI